MNHIEINNLKFGYTSDIVLDDLNLTVKEGELIAILGENGSGKSTLLKLILGEIKPQGGSIKILGKDSNDKKSILEIGYVPQIQNMSRIAFPITCLELVVLNLYSEFGFIKVAPKKSKEKAREILKKMGMSEYINTPFNELSGGFQQRALIARALINDPKIIILDEPTAGVDKENKVHFLKIISEMNKNSDKSIIIVTHELDVINKNITLDHVYKMDEGRLVSVTV